MSISLIEQVSTEQKLDNGNKEKVYCDDVVEYRIYCHVCDKLAIDRFYNSHLKSQTHMKIFRKRHQLNNTNNPTSSK